MQVAQAAEDQRNAATAGAGRSAPAISAAPSPAIHQRPRFADEGMATAAAARTTASSRSAGWLQERVPEGVRDGEGVLAAGDPEAERRRGAGERQRRVAEAGDDRGQQHRRGHLQRAPRLAADPLRGEREQAEREDRRQQRAEREEEPVARRAPGERQPGAGDRRVEERQAEEMFPSGSTGTASVKASPSRGRTSVSAKASSPSSGAASPREEGDRAGGPAGEERRPRRRGERSGAAQPTTRSGRRSRAVADALGQRVAEVAGEQRRRRPGRRVEREHPVDERAAASSAGRAAPTRAARRRSRSARAVSSSEPFQNGCRPASASQSITPTAQTSAAASPGSPCSRSGET